MTTDLTLMTLITLFTLAASGGALFVSMKVSSAQKDFSLVIANFKLELEHSLGQKFMTKKDCAMYENMRKELEMNYRGITTGKIEGIEVQIAEDKGDLTITLKSILAAISAFRDELPRRGERP